jgi:poly(A) polymerase
MSDPIAPTSKQPSRREDALAIVKRLRDSGHVAYFAGGCVRDELLGIQPKDYDVATDAPPLRVRELFRSTQAVGAAFGVILVRHGKSVLEVATFRSDGTYLDGRRPSEVHFTNAEEDAKRRDFTINGLFLDPIENQVIDYVGGRKDLEAKVLRAIGDADKRLEEDHLRVLRAIRFAVRFGFEIDPLTRDAIKRHVPQLTRISPERIADELRMMLTPPSRAAAWMLIQQFGLDEVIFRFVNVPRLVPHSEDRQHLKLSLFHRVASGSVVPFGVALATAVLEYASHRMTNWADASKHVFIRPAVRGVKQALRISNEELDTLEGTLYGLELLINSNQPGVSAMKRFLARPTAAASRALLNALPDVAPFASRKVELEPRFLELEKSDFAPSPLLTGDILVAEGWTPGPVFKRVLDQVYDAQLEDRITTREQALSLATQLRHQGVT